MKSQYFSGFELFQVSTPNGSIQLRRNKEATVIFCQRHQADPSVSYTPPHKINFKGIMEALKMLGCVKVLAFGSVGSLKSHISVGTLVVPDDYFNVWNPIAMYDDARAHIVPGFDEPFRQRVLKCLKTANFTPLESGVYVNTQGPRFETPAEIRMCAQYADVVGMTCAYEATIAATLKLPYCVVCMVDNMANGIKAKMENLKEFHEGLHGNEATMEKVLGILLAQFQPAHAPVMDMKDGVEKVDLVVCARYIVPVEPYNVVLENHAVVVKQGRIVDLCPNSVVLKKWAPMEYVDHSTTHVLFPGLINTHTHTGMTLLRGYADDVHLMDWLGGHIWPAETKFVSPEFVSCSASLAIAEMIKSGTTTFNDMYFYPEEIAKVVDQSGIRGMMGMILLDFPSAYASSPQDYIDKGLKLMELYKDHPRIKFSFAPHAPYTVSDQNLTKLRDLSVKHSVPIHIHLHETREEVESSEKGESGSVSCHRSAHKLRPFANLDRLGLVNQNLIAAHMTQLNADEIKVCGDKKVSVAHCPSSNLKLASGFCPVGSLLESGANVCLGTDSCASNNTLDLLSEVRLAAILAKPVRQDPTCVPAAQALSLATINGAKALGLGHDIGSLSVGKYADFVALDLDSFELMPLFNVLSQLAYACASHRISDVWVAGKQLLKNSRLTTVNEQKLKESVQEWQHKIADFRDEQASSRAKKRANTNPN